MIASATHAAESARQIANLEQGRHEVMVAAWGSDGLKVGDWTWYFSHARSHAFLALREKPLIAEIAEDSRSSQRNAGDEMDLPRLAPARGAFLWRSG